MTIYKISLLILVDREWKWVKDAYDYLDRIFHYFKQSKAIEDYRLLKVYKFKRKRKLANV